MDLTPYFTPALTRRRIAGWTPARQAAFVAALADGHSVRDAAAGVGLSPRGAYALRRQADAGEFALAWNAAIDAGAMRLTETAISHALYGERRSVFYRGKAVGEKIVHNDRLVMFLLARQRSRASPRARGSEECEVTAGDGGHGVLSFPPARA